MINRYSKYWTFFQLSFRQSWLNKTALSGMLFFLFILLFIYNRLWEVIGIEKQENHLNSTYIWYLLLAEMIILSAPRTERIIADDIKSGTLAYYINKPVSFFMMRFSEGLGTMSVSFLVMGIFGSLTTFFLTGTPPFSWINFPFIILMCYFSAIINVLFFTAVGFCALWLESIHSLAMAASRLAFIFGGAIFPLSIYPEWFINIARWTPFYSFYYKTIKLVYEFSWADLGQTLALNCFWILLIGVFIHFAYKKLCYKVNVYGG